MNKTRKIETLLLDADGVLQTTSHSFMSGLLSLVPDSPKQEEHQTRNPSARQKKFLEDVFAAEKPCLTGVSDFSQELARVLQTWAIEIPVSDVLELWHQIEPVPEILHLVAALRRNGQVVCLASNQQTHRASIMSNHLGYAALFDALYFSCDLGVAKPSPDFFQTILSRRQISPESTLFIDDHAENVTGAQAVGIHGAVYHIDQGPEQFTSILRDYGVSL